MNRSKSAPRQNKSPAAKKSAPRKMPASATGAIPIPISHPDKVFWPDEGYTKLDLVKYYQAVFPRLAPYVEDRILSLERCPDGMRGACFFQKEKPKGMPRGTPTKRIRHAGGPSEFTNYVVGGSLITQLALVNLGCIAVHVTGSRASSLRKPDWLCFDLDPQSEKFADAVRASHLVKESLETLKLVSFAKTSGSRGLHVFVPIRLGPDVDEVLAFAQLFVGRLAKQYPKELTVEHSTAARGKRVYLDPFRNGFGQTVVAPYSVRRKPHAPVSMPLRWSDVRPGLDPTDFHIGNFDSWSKNADPWEHFFDSRQSLESAVPLLDKL